MRITYLHQYFVTPEMGGGTRSYEMARRLVGLGHKVSMVTSQQDSGSVGKDWSITDEAGIEVHWTPVRYSNSMNYRERTGAFLAFARRAAARAASLPADIVFATSTPLTIALPAVYAARRLRVPMVFEVRDLWPAVPVAIGALRNPIGKIAARWLERFAYRNSARIVALAPGMKQHVAAIGYPADKISVVPNGCDLDLFGDADAVEALRSEHDWLGSRPLIVFAGSFGRINGMDYLVHLVSALARHDPEVRVVAIGEGREWARVQQLAHDLGILDRQLFLLGRLPKSETVAWIQAADMSIALFSGPEIVWKDAVQNKFFDSLAVGTPVINNFSGWQSQVAESEGAGIIVSNSDVNEAAAKILAVLRDADWLRAASDSARRLAQERFNRDDLALLLEATLRGASDTPSL